MEATELLSTDIGKGLQWLRKSLQLTQYQLATLTHLDYRHYQNIETGRVEVKVETLKRICTTFGVALSTFFYLMDRRPWAQDSSARNKTNAELFVYMLELEQAKFELQAPVRDLLSKWGRELAEGNRDKLKASPFPVLEVDSHGVILWRNTAAGKFGETRESHIRTYLASPQSYDRFRLAMGRFWDDNKSSFYFETPTTLVDEEDARNGLWIGLKPLLKKGEGSLFLTVVQKDEPQAEVVARGHVHAEHYHAGPAPCPRCGSTEFRPEQFF